MFVCVCHHSNLVTCFMVTCFFRFTNYLAFECLCAVSMKRELRARIEYHLYRFLFFASNSTKCLPGLTLNSLVSGKYQQYTQMHFRAMCDRGVEVQCLGVQNAIYMLARFAPASLRAIL